MCGLSRPLTRWKKGIFVPVEACRVPLGHRSYLTSTTYPTRGHRELLCAYSYNVYKRATPHCDLFYNVVNISDGEDTPAFPNPVTHPEFIADLTFGLYVRNLCALAGDRNLHWSLFCCGYTVDKMCYLIEINDIPIRSIANPFFFLFFFFS